jgi:flagellar biogenesis protein FliO
MTRLIVVTLLLAAVAVVLKLRTRTTTTTRSIKVTSRVSINRGSIVAVVEVDGRRLLVGAAANHVTFLTELDEVAASDEANPEAGATASQTVSQKTGLTRSRRSQPNRRSVTVAPLASTANPATMLIEKARQITTRTAEAKLRLPNRQAGAT